MARKYLQLVETYLRRFERGGYLTGDVVKFAKNFKSTEQYKSLGKNTQEQIDQMIESGLNVRVVGIKDTNSPVFPGNPQTSSHDVVLSLALDNGGGRYSHYISVPTGLTDAPEDFAPNLPPIPDAFRRPNNVNIKPKEYEKQDHITNKTDKGDGKLSDTEIGLAQKNATIPSNTVDQSPGQQSYTLKYLDGLK